MVSAKLSSACSEGCSDASGVVLAAAAGALVVVGVVGVVDLAAVLVVGAALEVGTALVVGAALVGVVVCWLCWETEVEGEADVDGAPEVDGADVDGADVEAEADVDGAELDGAELDGADVDGAEDSAPDVAALLVTDSGEVEGDSEAAVEPLGDGALGVLVGDATAGTSSVADGGTV